MRALCVFFVSYAGIRLKVRVLPHAKDVYAEMTGGAKWRMRAEIPEGFFQAVHLRARYSGLIVLAGNSRLTETVPHEVTHAVLHKYKSISAENDEPAAYAIGILTARILAKIHKRIKQ